MGGTRVVTCQRHVIPWGGTTPREAETGEETQAINQGCQASGSRPAGTTDLEWEEEEVQTREATGEDPEVRTEEEFLTTSPKT